MAGFVLKTQTPSGANNFNKWPLFPSHERAKKRLRESVHYDKGPLREDLTNYCLDDYDGLYLPVPLDTFPEWFERNRSDREKSHRTSAKLV